MRLEEAEREGTVMLLRRWRRAEFESCSRMPSFLLVSRSRHAAVYRMTMLSDAEFERELVCCLKLMYVDEAAFARQMGMLERLSTALSPEHGLRLPAPPLLSFGKVFSPCDGGKALWLATMWAEGEPLSRYITKDAHGGRPTRIIDALRLARAIAENIADLGRLEQYTGRGFVHGDIKPSNIIVLRGSPVRTVLVDFDTASAIGEERLIPCGTFGYVAPEVIGAKGRDSIRAHSAMDVYSLGVIMHELLVGRWPYCFSPRAAVNRALWSSHLDRIDVVQIERSLPEDVRNLLASCLAFEPAARPSPEEVVSAINLLMLRYENADLLCSSTAGAVELPTMLNEGMRVSDRCAKGSLMMLCNSLFE